MLDQKDSKLDVIEEDEEVNIIVLLVEMFIKKDVEDLIEKLEDFLVDIYKY